jgi:nicotinamide-nucleotide amidase
MLPEGADCLINPVGTAPGFVKKISQCRIFCIPGVPSEMRHMLSESVLPYIKRLQGDDHDISITKTLSLFGLPESAVGEALKTLPDEFPGIRLGLRAKFPEIHVKLYARGKEEKAMNDQIEKAAGWVLEQVGPWVFSTTGQTLAAEIGQLLLDRRETLAVAESCTGGLIANWLTDVPGSSGFFSFSGVTYANQAKIDVLGVSPDTLLQHGAVHENTVREMARGARKIAGTSFGLATSGIAGPDGGTDDKPVGTICIGLAGPGDVQAHRLQLSFGDRLRNKTFFATTALEILRRELLGIELQF